MEKHDKEKNDNSGLINLDNSQPTKKNSADEMREPPTEKRKRPSGFGGLLSLLLLPLRIKLGILTRLIPPEDRKAAKDELKKMWDDI